MMLFSGEHQGADLPKVEHSSPKTPSVHSTASSLSRRPTYSWADVTDDNSSDDQIWTPSSSRATSEFLPHVSSFTRLDSPSESEEAKQPLSPLTAGALLSYESSDLANAAQLLACRSRTQADDESSWADTACTSAASGTDASSTTSRPGQWSVGAELHAKGSCHPCIFYPKAIGCDNGKECEFCHLDHESSARHRRHLRRGRGRGRAKGDGEEQRTDPESITFLLPSALQRIERGTPPSTPQSGDKMVFSESLQATSRRGATSRKGGMRKGATQTSCEGTVRSIEGATQSESTESSADSGFVFPGFLASIFEGYGASSVTAAPYVQNPGCNPAAKSTVHRTSRRSKQRALKGPPDDSEPCGDSESSVRGY